MEEAPEGREIVLRCAAKPTLKAESILLYYRASGAPTYAVAAMQNTPKGWMEASIPAEAATGESMQYYCEARDSGDNVVATSGQEDIPNPIILTPASPGSTSVNPRAVTGGKGDGEDPLRGIKHEQDTEVLERGIHRRRQGALWFSAGWGTGVGYHMASLLEWRRDAPPVSAGWHQAGWYNSYWEIGYLIADHIGTAVQARWEYIPIEGSGDTNKGRPANGAISVIGRGLYYLDLGAGNAQIQFSADIGGGNGYRFAFPPTNSLAHPQYLTGANGVCLKDAGGKLHPETHLAHGYCSQRTAGLRRWRRVHLSLHPPRRGQLRAAFLGGWPSSRALAGGLRLAATRFWRQARGSGGRRPAHGAAAGGRRGAVVRQLDGFSAVRGPGLGGRTVA